MQSRSLAIAAALLMSASASTAMAQTIGAPGKGTGADTTRAAPISLPAAKPKPLPKVDPAAASRAFGETASADDYATVTLNHDGSTSEEPASDAVRAILEASKPSTA